MAALNQDFELFAGEDATVSVVVYDGETNTPRNISGFQVRWVAISQRTCDIVLMKDSMEGIEIQDPEAGIFYIPLSNEETKLISPGRYDHHATVTDLLGNVSVVTVGVMTIKFLGG